ncbi:hypothetical protein OTU49_007451 [Cherax quadricarinatus]|uniref:Peptidase M20 dimerisation domain-containing protein n=1 Tax=Cherax quadricarinatus TaxID=27406 RepID=A0AAW0X147_CHEQU
MLASLLTRDMPTQLITSTSSTEKEQCYGGVQYNVVPAELNVGFDIRVSPTQDLTKFEEKITSLCKSAGEDVTYEFVVNKLPQASEGQNQVTCVEDGKNPWWDAFSQACKHQSTFLLSASPPSTEHQSFSMITMNSSTRKYSYEASRSTRPLSVPLLT